jgi:multisubunit Na+/H+ antiporter MnhB subunit
VIGFFGGGVIAAVAAALVFLAFFPLPEPKPTDHTREALAVVVLVAFFCGGFIGRRAFSADFWSDLLPSVIGSYVVVGFLCLISSLDFSESAPMVGFVSAGIVSSAIVLLLLGRRFPPKTESYEV